MHFLGQIKLICSYFCPVLEHSLREYDTWYQQKGHNFTSTEGKQLLAEQKAQLRY